MGILSTSKGPAIVALSNEGAGHRYNNNPLDAPCSDWFLTGNSSAITQLLAWKTGISGTYV